MIKTTIPTIRLKEKIVSNLHMKKIVNANEVELKYYLTNKQVKL